MKRISLLSLVLLFFLAGCGSEQLQVTFDEQNRIAGFYIR